MKRIILLIIVGWMNVAEATQFNVQCPGVLSSTTLTQDVLNNAGKVRFHGDLTSNYNDLANTGSIVGASTGSTVELKCQFTANGYSNVGYIFEMNQTVNATSCIAIGGPFAPPYSFSCSN